MNLVLLEQDSGLGKTKFGNSFEDAEGHVVGIRPHGQQCVLPGQDCYRFILVFLCIFSVFIPIYCGRELLSSKE